MLEFLKPDERDDLRALLRHEGWRPLLAVINELCKDLDQVVLNYPLEKGSEGLVLAKARTEGARKLEREIATLKSKLLPKAEAKRP